ncbi:MAG TPA: GyrI-like domain-containing protein [Actinomycetes bacterium]|jgi:effector-binding domain-containing protein|nr:GyrI-like domain-containing protein [Actinomycetes bacterium]
MPTAPRIVERAEQPYVAVSGRVTMQTIGAIADRLPEVFAWLGARGLEPAGAPFFKYDLIDMERQLEVEAGVPVAAAAAGDGEVVAGVLPAGRYASLTHVGHPDELVQATTALLDWAAQQGLAWDMTETPEGERWGCRLEVYKTDPAEQPDMSKWETELLFRLAD